MLSRRIGPLLLALLCAAGSAAEVEEVGEAPEVLPRQRVDYLDRGRGVIGDRLIQLIDRADRFFGDENYEATTNESFLRVTPAIQVRHPGAVTFRLNVRANLELPRTERRLALALTGFAGDDEFPEDSLAEDEGFNAALRAVLFDDPKNKIRLSVGARFTPIPEPLTQLRYQRIETLGRFAFVPSVTGFWDLEDGFGERTRLDIDYAVSARSLARLRGEAEFGESTEGVEFLSSLSYIFSLRPRSAWVLQTRMSGATRPCLRDRRLVPDPNDPQGPPIVSRKCDRSRSTHILQTGALVRYRWSMFYPWLYFELEPGLRLEENTGFRPTFEGFARFEVVFGAIKPGRFDSANGTRFRANRAKRGRNSGLPKTDPRGG